MSSAMDAFRAQKVAVDQVHAKLTEVSDLLARIQGQTNAIATDKALRDILQQEGQWLLQTRQTLVEVRAFREDERRRFWPAMWRRWVVAVLFALLSAAAFGAGYLWAFRPYEGELVSLRQRVELLDEIGKRVIRMTPTERRQFDALMNSTVAEPRAKPR